jgi:hypothetical protein
MAPISERSVKLGQVMDQVLPWIWLVVGVGLVVFSIWGLSVCRATAHYYVSPRTTGMRILIFVATWFVLFLPFAFMGFLLVRSTLRQRVVAIALRRLQASIAGEILVSKKLVVEIIPPATMRVPTRDSVAPGDAGTAVYASYRRQGHVVRDTAQGTRRASLSPLDEATTRRMDELGIRAAKVAGIAIGLFFLGIGISGVVMAWIYAHRPPGPYSSIHSELSNFRLTILFLVGCGLAVAIGGFILRSTFKTAETGWLGPLQAFTAVVSRRAVQEQVQSKEKGQAD